MHESAEAWSDAVSLTMYLFASQDEQTMLPLIAYVLSGHTEQFKEETYGQLE